MFRSAQHEAKTGIEPDADLRKDHIAFTGRAANREIATTHFPFFFQDGGTRLLHGAHLRSRKTRPVPTTGSIAQPRHKNTRAHEDGLPRASKARGCMRHTMNGLCLEKSLAEPSVKKFGVC